MDKNTKQGEAFAVVYFSSGVRTLQGIGRILNDPIDEATSDEIYAIAIDVRRGIDIQPNEARVVFRDPSGMLKDVSAGDAIQWLRVIYREKKSKEIAREQSLGSQKNC